MRQEPNSPGSEHKSGSSSQNTTPEKAKASSPGSSKKSTPPSRRRSDELSRPHTPQPPSALDLSDEAAGAAPPPRASTPPHFSHRITPSPTNKGNSVESILTTTRAIAFFNRNSGIFINKKGEIIYSKKDADSFNNKLNYLLYSFVEYFDEQGISCIFALPVFKGFDSRHSVYTQFLGIPKDNIVNGGEIIFKKNTDNSFEIALWTDKTGTFCNIMYLNLLRICKYPIAELERLATSGSIPDAKTAIRELGNYSPPLPSETYVSPDAWEALISIHATNNLATRAEDNSVLQGSSALFSQEHSIYKRNPTDPGLEFDFNRLAPETIALTQRLIVMAEGDEEVIANQLFSSLCI